MNLIALLIGTLLTIHVIVCLLLIFIVLMQRPRSEGLGTAFGGGVTDTLFGSSTGNVLTKITTWLGTIFFITTISLAYLYSHRPSSTGLRSKLPSISSTVSNSTGSATALTSTNAAPKPAK